MFFWYDLCPMSFKISPAEEDDDDEEAALPGTTKSLKVTPKPRNRVGTVALVTVGRLRRASTSRGSNVAPGIEFPARPIKVGSEYLAA